MHWLIGNVEIKNQVVLAPMAGISNPGYIKICEELGVGYAITELISAEALVRENKKTLAMLNGIDKLNIPVAVQIFGSDPKILSKAAQLLVSLYPVKIIDINMGCPVPKVAVKSGGGSGLLKNPELVAKIVTSVVNSVSIPVTVKIRSGWDASHINAPEIAKICEKCGAKAITIHARTRSQGYSGSADWNIIKMVKQEVSIPVIGNGDILSCYDAKKMLVETGCDAVMIGRATLGNPWLITECVEYLKNGTVLSFVSLNTKLEMMIKHINILTSLKDEVTAVLELRSILCHYLKGIPNTKELKLKLIKANKKEELIKIIRDYAKEVKE